MWLKNTLLFALFACQALCGLFVVNPSSLKDKFGKDAQIKSKLSNIGIGTFQKGTARIGQVITPFIEDGQGC